MFLSKKVIISACLLGEYCRYDGKTKDMPEILEHFKEYEIIPFCPEAPLFGTPRERISVLCINGKNKIYTDETKRDVTRILEEEIISFVNKNPNIDALILKSKSPSCGNGTTPVLDTKDNTIRLGDGKAVEIFKKMYKNPLLLDENRFFN